MHSPYYRYTLLLLLSHYLVLLSDLPSYSIIPTKVLTNYCQPWNTYTTGATAPRRALRQRPGVVSTRSRCNTLSLGSKLIISSLHTGPSCQPPRSRIHNACINAINQSSFNQSEDSSPSINQFNPKGSKYPINQVRAPWID